MSLRTFTAPDGSTWDVWDVRPMRLPDGFEPPRLRDRRGQDILLYRGPERRSQERRADQRSPFRSGIDPAGWLVFQSGDVKRRLAPPPPAWEEFAEGELVRLWTRSR